MSQTLFNGKLYNDDRMFVLCVLPCYASLTGSFRIVSVLHDGPPEECRDLLKEHSWCVATYVNTQEYPPSRVDVFNFELEAKKYCDSIEPEVPLVSHGGQRFTPKLSPREFSELKAEKQWMNFDASKVFPPSLKNRQESFYEERRFNNAVVFRGQVEARLAKQQLPEHTHASGHLIGDDGEPAVQLAPRDLAIELMSAHRYAYAIPILLQLNEMQPGDWGLPMMTAQCFRFCEDFANANRFYQKALDLNDGDPQIPYSYGISLQLDGQLEESISMLKRAISMSPTMFAAYNSLGLTYRKMEDFENALDWYHRAADGIVETFSGEELESNPLYAFVLNNAGVCERELGRFDNAVELFQQSIECTPTGFEYPDPHKHLWDLE
jgi:tetratricopeptide (TPR) repeat protein